MNYPIQNSLNNVFTDHGIILWPDQSYFKMFFSQDFQPNTKKALVSDFRHFMVFYVGMNKEPFTFKRLVESDVVSYKQVCQQQGHAVATINRRLIHLRMLCDFAIKHNRMTENPAKKVKLLHSQRLAPKSLEPSELRKLMKEVEIRGKLRDIVALSMAAQAGFRVSELAALKIENIVLSERKGYATVKHGKANKTREVPLNSRLRELLTKYTEGRNTNEKLFKSQRGYLTALGFSKMLDFYAKKAGVKCHMHKLRHSFSFMFLQQNQNDIVALADLLGHTNISTTARYGKNRLSDLQKKVEIMVY